MKPLILTLLLAVVLTTIGAGWVITQFHTKLVVNSTEADQQLGNYKQLAKSIGLTLDEYPDQESFIAHWEEKSDIDIAVQERSDFMVPINIAEDFESGTPLLLESEGELSVHLLMTSSNKVMSLSSVVEGNVQPARLNIFLTLLFYSIVIAVLLMWLFPLIKRLMTLQKTAKQLGTGDLSSRVSLSRFSYISSIEHDFNRMAHQIQTLVDDNQMLSRAVSHNLKTPLTRLRMGVDVLEETTDKSEMQGYVKRINNDLDEMQSLVETLLQYSKLDEFKLRLKNEPVDLCVLIPKLIENEKVPNINIKGTYSDDSIIVNTDARYLAMSLVNILSNAAKHAKSTVEVRVENDATGSPASGVTVSVEDDGCGISDADLEHVTKPFWQGNTVSTNQGHGMGLAIVARISKWLQSTLTIAKSERLGGASVSLQFDKP